MKLTYDEQAAGLYFDFAGIADRGYAFNFVIGGRGIGKTYGAFKYCQQRGKRFMYLRSGDPEWEMASNENTTPIRAHWSPLVIRKGKGAAAVFDGELGPDDKILPKDQIGYTASLSTFKNMRGAELHAFYQESGGICIYDEFIRERSAKRTLKDEFDAFYNFYETAFREAPVQTFLFSNSVELNSPILARLDLIRPIEYMLIHKMDSWTDETRKILIYLPHDIPITEVKRHTALNVLAAGTQAASSALDNDFSYMDVHDVKREPLQQYKPVCVTESDGCSISMWQHKSDERLYFARVNASAPKVTPALMRAAYQPIYKRALLLDKLRFDDYHLKIVVQDILD
jgi:hypothetical protein